MALGIDVPMEGNDFLNFVYPWPFYTTNTRWLDNATYNEVPKGSGRQINYGTGKAVSQESIADAGEIRWLPGSYLDFPVRRLLPGRAPARELDFLGASVVFTF